jgi:UDPglucose 6-dehydrogenase
MRVCFLGTSHAARHLSAAAKEKGFELCGIDDDPALVFVSEDVPTDANGVRDMRVISGLLGAALVETRSLTSRRSPPIIITSQVEPGFTRDIGDLLLFHQAETLRIKDAAYRASHPEMFIVGCAEPDKELPPAYQEYLHAFNCPVLTMSYESAEFAKMAINAFLISQVETTNMLSRLAARCGANWKEVIRVLQNDSRIGPNAYLEPGEPLASKHLLRDYATLREIAHFHGDEALLRAWDGQQYT